MFSLRTKERRTLLVAIDLVIVELTTLLAFWLMAVRGGKLFGLVYLLDHYEWFIFLPALWFFSAWVSGFYNQSNLSTLTAAAAALLRSVALVIGIYLLIYYFFPIPGELPRGIVGYQGAASFILITLWRIAYADFMRRPSFTRPVIIVGAGLAGQTIAQTIAQAADDYFRILGFVDDDPSKQNQSIGILDSELHLPVIGAARDLTRLVKEQGVPELILAINHDISSSLFQALLDCKEQGVQITLMPVLFEQLTGMVPVEHIGDNWNVALPLDSAEANGFYPILKRLVDITGALLGLAIYLLLLPFLVIAIKLDSPGPVFYAQKRVGKGGKIFDILKLRTMVVDAEWDGRAVRAQEGDVRITRIGRLLRKARLDEMPQLLCILNGDMSAVGPRPERPELMAELDAAVPFHRLRNAVKPGMAGWAMINFHYVDNVEDAKVRLQYDLYYIKHQSLWLDFIILFRAVGQIIALKGR
jgi:exopolysaccharide biosynthesis polyprenyl glycosylphosphotransferase